MTHFDATARISVDLSAFSRAAQQAGRETGAWTTATNQLQQSISKIEPIEKRRAQNISRTLQLYQRIAQAVGSYATAIDRLSSNNIRASSASQRFNTVLRSLGNSLSTVRGIGEKEFERLNRTITLYERLARAVSTYASALDRMSAINQRHVAAQERANRANEKAAADAARLALQQQRVAIAQQNATIAAQRAEVAKQRLSNATNRATISNINMATSLFSIRSALTDYQSAMSRVRDALLALPSAAFSAAIAQEAAFAHIARVTQETNVDLQAMRSELQRMSTEVPIAFEQLARIGVLGAQIGIARENLLIFTDTVARFAATTAVSEEQTALLAGRIAQLAQVPETEFVNLLSGISELGSNSAATEEAILRMTEQIATSTRAAGIGTEAMIGLAGAIASLGLRPELARGALQRVFAILRDNIDDAGDALERMADLMDMTAQEVVNLQRTDPEKFFLAFIEGTGRAQENGEALRRTLRDIGVGNTRDIELISRLGLNYDFLAGQIELANQSYAEGTFLQRESEKIFGTTRAALDRLSNAWQNFQANAVDPMLRILAPALSAVAAAMNAISQSPIASTLAGIAIAVALAAGAWVAYRVALAGIATGLIAMRQIQAQLGTQTVNLNTVWSLYRNTQVQAGAATAATTAALRAQGTQAAFNAASINAVGAAMGAAAVNTSRMATASRGLAAVTALGGPLGLALTGVSVLAGALAVGMLQTRDSVSAAARAGIDAAGGFTQLAAAIREDTEAALAGGRAYQTLERRKSTISDTNMALVASERAELEARRNSILELYRTRDALEETARSQTGAGIAAQKHVKELDALEARLNGLEQSISGVTLAFGDQAVAFQVQAVSAAVAETALVRSDAAMQRLADTGIDLGENLRRSFTDPQGAINELNARIREQEELYREVRRAEVAISRDRSQAGKERRAQLNEELEGINGVIEGMRAQRDVLTANHEQFKAQTREAQIFGDAQRAAAGDVDALGNSLEDAALAADGMGESIAEVTGLANEFSNTLSGLGTPLTAWQAAVDRTNASARSAWERTHKSLDGFVEGSRASLSTYKKELEDVVAAQRNWATNMVELASRVPPDVAAQLGRLGPEAAPLIAELVKASDKELSELVPLFRATSEEASLQLAQGLEFAIPAMEGIGGRAGHALAQTLSNELRRSAATGGDFSTAINQFLDLLQMIDEAEANPYIDLNDVTARKTLDDFEAELRKRERAQRLDPKGFAQLNPELYQMEMQTLEGNANRVTRNNTIGPTGVPELDTSTWESELGEIEGRTDRTTRQNDIGPEGDAGLTTARYINELARLATRSKQTGQILLKALSVNPRLNTATIYNQMAALRDRARATGASIQASLTRTATVTVRVVQRDDRGQQRLADGGWVTGPGGPRQDKVPAWLSPGEFVVNARAAARYGAILEQINSFRGSGGASLMPGLTAKPFTSNTPSAPAIPRVMAPERMSAQGTTTQPRMVINVHNTYPRSEPTSVTVNRALAFAAALDGV